MPDILIRGLVLPDEPTAFTIFPNGDVYDFFADYKYGTAVQLPPHGDLIDRDELNKCRKEFCHGKNGWEYDYVEDRDIDAAAVIVPASPAKEAQ